MSMLREEQVLELAEFLLIMGDLLGRGFVALVAVREGGIDLLELHFRSRRNFEAFQSFHMSLHSEQPGSRLFLFRSDREDRNPIPLVRNLASQGRNRLRFESRRRVEQDLILLPRGILDVLDCRLSLRCNWQNARAIVNHVALYQLKSPAKR